MTDPAPKSSKPADADPRLLLPDWLRDDPPEGRSEPPAPTQPAIPRQRDVRPQSTTTERQPDDLVPEREPVSTWQKPPARIESWDPSRLVAAGDLPTWISNLPARTEPVDPAPAIPPPVSDILEPPSTVDDAAFTPAAPAEPQPESIATAPESKTSDLTETGFVLIAGATLVIIAAVIALFYL